MKTVAYTALHYGKPYLGYAIQSVIDAVDEYIVLYSDHPSHNGGKASLPCPDTEQELHAIAATVAGRKLRWIKGDWRYENQQRESIYQHAPDADVILVVDSDEVWRNDTLETAIRLVDNSDTQRWRVPIVHFWRSFYRAVLHDPAFPIRVIKPHAKAGEETLTTQRSIAHFGYALPIEYIAYKWSGIHGHQGEYRRDCDWFKDVYVANRQFDCHPVGSEHWNPEPVDPWLYLPGFMKSHPYSKMEVIE